MSLACALFVTVAVVSGSDAEPTPRKPLLRTVELDLGESGDVELSDGTRVTVKLLEVEELRDALRSAVRQARVRVEVNGKSATLISGNYHLPMKVGGVQVDCPATKGLYRNHDPWEDSWGLDKDV